MSDQLSDGSLDLLRTFLAVHRAGSITAGARALGLSQPTVTSQIQALEQQRGRQLFERGARGVRPTAVGDELAARIAGPLDELSLVIAPSAASAPAPARPPGWPGRAARPARGARAGAPGHPGHAAADHRGLGRRPARGPAPRALRPGHFDRTPEGPRPDRHAAHRRGVRAGRGGPDGRRPGAPDRVRRRCADRPPVLAARARAAADDQPRSRHSRSAGRAGRRGGRGGLLGAASLPVPGRARVGRADPAQRPRGPADQHRSSRAAGGRVGEQPRRPGPRDAPAGRGDVASQAGCGDSGGSRRDRSTSRAAASAIRPTPVQARVRVGSCGPSTTYG